MKYLLFICGDDESYQAMLDDETFLPACKAWAQEMERRGMLLGTGGLQGPDDATTVRVRDGQVLLTDGPFAETKEALGGFYLIECADLDAALGWARRVPSARTGRIEVRPVFGSS
jgi:hypothetical protein